MVFALIFLDFRPADAASPIILSIIEDELNLEELMRQKALLQARLGAYMSDPEAEDKGDLLPHTHSQQLVVHTKSVLKAVTSVPQPQPSKSAAPLATATSKHANIKKSTTHNSNESDVILLDDSSGGQRTPRLRPRNEGATHPRSQRLREAVAVGIVVRGIATVHPHVGEHQISRPRFARGAATATWRTYDRK